MQSYDRPPPVYESLDDVQHIWRWGPGKSGPRLVQDLSVHTLGGEALIGFPSSLTDNPPRTDRHTWIIDLAYEEEFGDATILRACCEKTRMHVELVIEYGDELTISVTGHCQAQDKLHHFQLLEEDTVQQPKLYDSFIWTCSRCPTRLQARLRAPEIPEQQLEALYAIRPQSTFSSPGARQTDENKPSRFSTLQGLEYLLRNTATFNLEDVPGLAPREIQYAPDTLFSKRVGHEPEIIDMMKALMFIYCPAYANIT